MLAAIQSFNDPSIIINIFRDLGWSYSVEIQETLALAKQNANLSIKFKAIKHLRELLREAAETAGYIANVSSTTPNAQGGQTTFSAKRIAGSLNPIKKIESTVIKEPQNDKSKEIRTEPDRDGDRGESEIRLRKETHSAGTGGTDTGTQFPPDPPRAGRTNTERDADIGGTESPDGGETPERQRPGRTPPRNTGDTESDRPRVEDKGENPCVKTRPPTSNQNLFPGISTSAGEDAAV